jgi:hypothetical protein
MTGTPAPLPANAGGRALCTSAPPKLKHPPGIRSGGTAEVQRQMKKNERRVERIKAALGCRTDIELAKLLKSYPPNISRWKKRGFYPAIANLIDELLSRVDKKSK